MCLAEGFRQGYITSVEDGKEKSRKAAEEVEALEAAKTAPAAAAVPAPAAAEPAPLESFTVEQLKAQLRERGLKVSGRKAELIERLRASAPSPTPTTPVTWTKHPLTEANFPAGEYYIGDLCYVLPDELYHGVWGDKFGYETGYFTDGKNAFAMHHTSWGDGSYEDEEGNKYSVDAGIIGIAPAALLKSRDEPGRYITFTEPVTFRTEGRDRDVTFVIKSGYQEIRIET
jgi:hypothetical protein